jgi:hypothetical protein
MALTADDLLASYVVAGEYYKIAVMLPKVIDLLSRIWRWITGFTRPKKFWVSYRIYLQTVLSNTAAASIDPGAYLFHLCLPLHLQFP